MKNQKGFTLIELMIVVAIIAILAAIAISQYQDYVIRSQVSEGSSLADGVKTAIGEFVNNRGYFPPSNVSAGLATDVSINGTYVSQVSVIGGSGNQLEATYSSAAPQKANAQIDTMTLIFSPITQAGSIKWACISTTLKQKWCPSSCTCT
jgi:type IV pilus assembly protein PilA